MRRVARIGEHSEFAGEHGLLTKHVVKQVCSCAGTSNVDRSALQNCCGHPIIVDGNRPLSSLEDVVTRPTGGNSGIDLTTDDGNFVCGRKNLSARPSCSTQRCAAEPPGPPPDASIAVSLGLSS